MADVDLVASLRGLARNLRWAWDAPTQEVFRAVDPVLWEARRDPAEVISSIKPERESQLAEDPEFLRLLGSAEEGLAGYVADKPSTAQVAYFCMEHGVAPNLRIYAGGLGVLAGDIEKTASDLNVPMVGVGLLYQWRLRQRLAYGWQHEEWDRIDPLDVGLTPCPSGTITLDIAGQTATVRVWRAAVGRVDLYLLDTDVPQNPPGLREITDRLYGGDREHRLRQELVLGVGGHRALAALGIHPQVVHANEGHAGFVCLERVRQLIHAGEDLDSALRTVAESTVFTTHTAVPAGFDLFERPLIEKYFAGWADECGVSMDRLLQLGHFPDQRPDEPFNMALLCAHLSGYINAVSRLHREVTEQRVLGRLWPGQAAPVRAITNGVHPTTWAPRPMATLFERYVGAGWEYADAERWDQIWQVPDEELWDARQRQRAALVAYVREHLPATLRAAGWGDDLDWAERVLDPRALTVVVARRAAEYKETDLLVSMPDRLRALTLDLDRPVCVLFAGLAHPRDGGGKERIRRIVDFSLQEDVRAHVVYVPGYDMRVAMALLAGADIWLNHPRRGDEACGTSFMKSVYSGGRILTTADGGADELLVHQRNGWLIGGRVEGVAREETAARAFDLLESEVVPQFYDRRADGLPHAWIHGIKRSLASLAWQVSSAPAVRGYQRLYREAIRSPYPQP